MPGHGMEMARGMYWICSMNSRRAHQTRGEALQFQAVICSRRQQKSEDWLEILPANLAAIIPELTSTSLIDASLSQEAAQLMAFGN